MKFRMTAVCALADIAAEISGFTVDEGTGSFQLYIRNVMSTRKERAKGKIPYLLNLIITDGAHLPSNQKDC